MMGTAVRETEDAALRGNGEQDERGLVYARTETTAIFWETALLVVMAGARSIHARGRKCGGFES